MAKKNDFYVCAQQCDNSNNGEWLFDLTIVSYDWIDGGPKRYLKRIPLIMESEWGNLGDIIDDFEKLLVARAELRLMVFQSNNTNSVEDIFGVLQDIANNCGVYNLNDRFLLMGWGKNNHAFKPSILQHQLPS